MAKNKNIQISYELFMLLLRFHVLEDTELQPDIKKALESKLDSLVRRELYTKSKDPNLTQEEREKARQEYLDRVGMHDDFRWPQ